MPSAPLIIASGFSKFRYVVADASGRARGELRLKTLPKDPIQLQIDGRAYRIDYERTNDRFIASDFRFSLIDATGAALAVADKVAGKKDYIVNIGEATYRFENRSGLFSLGYALTGADPAVAGNLAETTGFSLWKRRFRFDLPTAIDGATGMFLFFLAANLRYR